MKKTLLFILLSFITLTFPYRVVALTAAMLTVNAGATRVDEGNDQFWRAIDLELALNDLGADVMYQKDLNFMGRAAYGLTNKGTREIYIEEKLSWNGRLAVLAHEAGHLLQPRWLNEQQAECFAEGVATVFVRDNIREHARHLAMYSKGDCLLVFIAEWHSIYQTASMLENR